jgi:hypothetical protein
MFMVCVSIALRLPCGGQHACVPQLKPLPALLLLFITALHDLQGMGGAAAAGGMAMGAPAAGGWQGGGAPQQATAFAGAAAGNGMDPCSNVVLQIIQGCNSEAGCHVQEVRGAVGGLAAAL